MIGVTYGAPTEFRAQGKIFTDSINWKPSDVKGSMWQDDVYVQLTFMMAMDKYGIDAPAKTFQEMFAKAGYPLWHANVQSRKIITTQFLRLNQADPKTIFMQMISISRLKQIISGLCHQECHGQQQN